MAIGNVDTAYAAGDIFQPINSVFTTLLNFMTGTFATTAATIACAAVGYMALTSRIPWSWCFSIIVGIAFIFGGSQLVQSCLLDWAADERGPSQGGSGTPCSRSHPTENVLGECRLVSSSAS
ncbi:TrbC/VirB2 family protein [Rhizobium beringeri]